MSPTASESPVGPKSAASAPNRLTEAFGDWTPQAVVFDCDGLLLDTETVWQRAQDTVVDARGVTLSAADEATLHGSTLEDAAALIAARAGIDPQTVDEDLRREFDLELGTGIRLMPGAEEIVRLAGAKVPLGCASNSWLESLEEKLVLGGLREHFAVLEASDTVERAKPAPDMYAAAARALGVDPVRTLAFEDSGTGAQAARDAGLRLIAVPAPGHPVPSADLVLGDLTDPDLASWIATW